jgi:predicted heme/steroid binding protein
MIGDLAADNLAIELQKRGIALRCAGDRLMVSDPKKALTSGLRTQIKRNKPALLARLKSPIGLAVLAYPTDQARYDLLVRLMWDPRCLAFYAAGRDLSEAIDREDIAAIALAQNHFDQALADARALADEITNALERITA